MTISILPSSSSASSSSRRFAAIKALFPGYVTTNRAAYLVPNIKFGKEAVEVARSFAPTPYHRDELIRHHIGREHVCTEPKFNALAKEFEKLGRSPAKAV